MRVMKFGGAVTKNTDGFSAMARILGTYSGEPIVLVISAFSTATRDLERSAFLAERGAEESALALSEEITAYHKRLADLLLQSPETLSALHDLLEEARQRLRDFLRGVAITRELTDRTLDTILSFGEFLAVHIARHYLQEQGFDVRFADALSLIATDNNHLSATPNREKTAEHCEQNLKPLLANGKIVITQGFVGRGENGEVTTMGKESSNLTATLLGEMLRANEVIIWTDVEGIRSADPKLVSKTALLPHLSYAQALTAALNGVKLLHPQMIEPVRRAGISLEFRSAFAPDGEHTVISNDSARSPEFPPVVALQSGVSMTLVQFSLEASAHINALTKRLFPQGSEILSLTHRSDSLCVVSTRPPLQSELGALSGGIHVRSYSDYSMISILGVSPQKVLAFVAEVQDILQSAEHPFVEIGAHPDVSRIAVPRSAVELLFVLSHDHIRRD